VAFYYRSICDECRTEENRKRLEKTANRPESHRRRDKKKGVALQFGLSLAEYDAAWRDFLIKQGGVCAVCNKRKPEVLDHCHTTGRLRGVLCRQCNSAAGFLMDDSKVAERLSRYLKGGQ
jgi:hypothetical protein